MRLNQKQILPTLIFIPTIIIVGLNILSVIFPALLSSFLDPNPFYEKSDLFEFGESAFIVIFGNLLIFGIAIIYRSGSFPIQLVNSIKKIIDFEISKKISIMIIFVLLVIYVGFSYQELLINEEKQIPDFRLLKTALEQPFAFIEEEVGIGSHKGRIVKTFLVLASLEFFGNLKLIPFLASISLLIFTYLLTLTLTKKRFAGIIAMVVLLQSSTFRHYDTLATYDTFWILFYLVSLYLIHKRSYLSSISFLCSLLSKPLTSLLYPVTIFYIYNSSISKQMKMGAYISYGLLGAVAIGIIFVIGIPTPFKGFNEFNFLNSFSSFPYGLRLDYFLLVFLLPITISLYAVTKRGLSQGASLMVLLLGTLLLEPLLTGFGTGRWHPYHFLPLVTFFAICTGSLFSKELIQRPIDDPIS